MKKYLTTTILTLLAALFIALPVYANIQPNEPELLPKITIPLLCLRTGTQLDDISVTLTNVYNVYSDGGAILAPNGTISFSSDVRV